MAYKSELKQYVKVGSTISVTYQGKTYTGEVLKYEHSTIQDASITLEDEDGKRHVIPIPINMPPVVTATVADVPAADDESKDEEYEDDEEETDKKKLKQAESELPKYNNFDDAQLIKAANKRGIKLTEGGKKLKRKQLIEKLKMYDREQLKKK